MKKDVPQWVAEEISGAKWEYKGPMKSSGYILDIYQEKNQIDVQFYDKLPDDRYIATLDTPPPISLNKFEKGKIYIFELKSYAAKLTSKLSEFFTKEYSLKIESIYRYELISIEELQQVARKRLVSTPYTRGRSREYMALHILRNKGWVCSRSAMSHSPVDIFAAKNGRALLIQVKSGKSTLKHQELIDLRYWAKAFGAPAELWHFMKGGGLKKKRIYPVKDD